MLGEGTGRSVEFRDDPGGAPGPMGFLLNLARSGALESQTDDLRRLLGRPPADLRRAVEQALAPGQPLA